MMIDTEKQRETEGERESLFFFVFVFDSIGVKKTDILPLVKFTTREKKREEMRDEGRSLTYSFSFDRFSHTIAYQSSSKATEGKNVRHPH